MTNPTSDSSLLGWDPNDDNPLPPSLPCPDGVHQIPSQRDKNSACDDVSNSLPFIDDKDVTQHYDQHRLQQQEDQRLQKAQSVVLIFLLHNCIGFLFSPGTRTRTRPTQQLWREATAVLELWPTPAAALWQTMTTRTNIAITATQSCLLRPGTGTRPNRFWVCQPSWIDHWSGLL